MRIGYLGLGAMGGALSTHLAKGFDLAVYDRSPEAMAKLVSHGAQAVNSPAELARRSDIILLCLPRTTDVQNALFGSGGLAEGLSASKLVIDQTSGVPSLTHAIAQRLELQGIAMMDAPVSGGIPAAQNGKVTIIASGADEAWMRAEPVLRAMTSKVFRCSARVGDGQALKLVNNAIGAGYRKKGLKFFNLPMPKFLTGGKGNNKKLENEINFRLDFKIRDNVTANSRLDQDNNFATGGSKEITISPTIDYFLNNRVNIKLYFDQRRVKPYVSSSAPITNTRAGVQVRISLAQ